MQSCLFKEDTELFFKLHPALLQYVNCCLKIFPKIKTAEALRNSGPENVARVRAKLLERFDFIDEFNEAYSESKKKFGIVEKITYL